MADERGIGFKVFLSLIFQAKTFKLDGKMLTVHEDSIYFSKDNTVFSADFQGNLTSRISGHRDELISCAFMKNNRIMICLSEDNIVAKDILTKSTLQTYKSYSKAHLLCPLGRTRFLSCENSIVYLWSLDDKKSSLGFYGHKDYITDIKPLNDDNFATCNYKRLFLGSYDHTLRIWSVSSRKCIKKIELGAPIQKCLVKGDMLIFCSKSCIFVWNNTVENCSNFVNFGDVVIKDMVLLKDYLILLTLDNMIEVFNLNSWSLLNSYHSEERVDKIYAMTKDFSILLELCDSSYKKIIIGNVQVVSSDECLRSCIEHCKTFHYLKAFEKALLSTDISVLNQTIKLIPLQVVSTFIAIGKRFPENLLLFSYSKSLCRFYDILFDLFRAYRSWPDRYVQSLLESYCESVSSGSELYSNILKSLGILEKFLIK